MDINRVNLVGRIVRDCGTDQYSFGYTQGGTARAVVSVAVNRSRKQGDQWVDEANFFDITIWGKTAENLKPYLTKGKQIAIDGYLKQDRWEKDGQKFSKVVIVADNVQLCGNRDDGQRGGGYDGGFQQSQSREWQESAPTGGQGGMYAPRPQPGNPYQQPGGGQQGFPGGQAFPGSQQGFQGGGFPEDIPF